MRKKLALQLPFAALFLFLAAAPPLARATEKCYLTTFVGPYAVATVGQDAVGYWTGLFLLTSDGNGNLSGTGAESLNGTIYSGVTASGTYTASTDCWFTATTTDSLGNVRNFSGMIVQHGKRVDGVSGDPGTDWQFTIYRQHLTLCSQSSGAGYFVSNVQSLLTPSGPTTATRQWHINLKGSGTGSWEENTGGLFTQGTATAAFSINSNCTYTATITGSDGTTGHFFGVQGILELDNVAWLQIETDTGWVTLETGVALCSIWPIC